MFITISFILPPLFLKSTIKSLKSIKICHKKCIKDSLEDYMNNFHTVNQIFCCLSVLFFLI